ncbi:S9 family peptidase [Pseudactinotalea sp. Z1739]|uniref:S9 family peptidase n=1 Tax=Pseudactinotalea sp. Z1739 TaxID=3413028 RepID=UPI003C79B65E
MRPEHLNLLHSTARPAVHPDGTWAVIAVSRPDLEEDTYPSRLWRLDLGDGALRPLTHGLRDAEPVISPDGRYLAFLRAAKGDKPQLALMRVDGGEPQLLTDHPLGVSGRPEFSPDSTRIAYTARVPEDGRYGTTEGVGPDAEPPRHITRFTYRLDGAGFHADRPQHVYVIAVHEENDPMAAGPGASSAAAPGPAASEPAGSSRDAASRGASNAAASSAAESNEDESNEGEGGTTEDEAGTLGARKGVQVRPVAVTAGERDHREPVWTHDGTHLLITRGVVDELRSELIRVPAPGADRSGDGAGESASAGPDSAGSRSTDQRDAPAPEPEVLQGLEHGAVGVRTGPGDTLWLLISDLGPDAMDFIGKTPALHRARLTRAGLTDLEQVTDPRTGSLTNDVFLADGADVLLTRLNRGSTELVRYTGGELRPVFGGQVSVAGAGLLPGGGVLVSASTPDSAGDLFVVEQSGGADEEDVDARRLTDLSARLHEQAGVFVPQELQVDGEDGYPVHGWVTVPEGEGPHPVLLLIHGGPHAQYESVLFDEVQVYTRAGYAVVFCNPRGSAGYGQDHGRSIIQGFGDRDAADVLAFLDGALAAHPGLDAQRVGVLGGSYGGYMTAWLTTRTDRFVAAIVERGFLDPVSFEGSSDIGWFFGIKYLGEDPEQVAAQSPMAHIDKVATPTMVIHSEQDWRCPVEQGQRWFVGLKRRGVETEFLLFPGEGHELSRSGRPKHRLARFEHILTWWDKHLPVR